MMNDELLKLVNMAGFYLQAKKVRDLVTSEIRKYGKEIEHLQDRVDTVKKRLRETMDSVEEIEIRMVESRKQLLEAEAEMRAAEEENTRTEDFQHEVERKRARLPDLKLQVSQLREEVQAQYRQLQVLQSDYHEAVAALKLECEQEVVKFEERLSHLKQELPVMQNTRDIIAGKMPEHFDTGIFQSLRGGLGMNLDDYVGEVSSRLSDLEQEISSLKSRLDEEEREKETLLLLEKDLRVDLESLSADEAIVEAKESILSEVTTLEEDQARLGRESDTRKSELQDLRSGVSDLDEGLRREEERERELSARIEYLNSRARELEKAGNFEDEIKRLVARATRLDIDLEVNSNFHHLMHKIRDDAESTNVSIRGAIADYKEVFDRLKHVVISLEESVNSEQ